IPSAMSSSSLTRRVAARPPSPSTSCDCTKSGPAKRCSCVPSAANPRRTRLSPWHGSRLVLQEKALLRDIGLASLTLSVLTIFPPLVVMSAVDKVLTYQSYSTLILLAVMLAIAAVFEAFLGYARRLIVLVVAGESTERFMRRCRRRGRFRPMRRLCGACAANPCFCGFSAR